MSLDVYLSAVRKVEVYDRNVTHNLCRMADAAGIYKHLWRPEEIGVTLASQLIEPLKNALEDLNERPQHYKQFNPPNGWGDYDGFVKFVADYLHACRENPDAEVRVSR